jgi:hypothetical protein
VGPLGQFGYAVNCSRRLPEASDRPAVKDSVSGNSNDRGLICFVDPGTSGLLAERLLGKREVEMDPFIAALVSHEGFAAARQALMASFDWFLHASHIRNFAAIRGHGLLPREPGMRAPPEVVQALGRPGNEIVCLRPVPTSGVMPVGGPAFILALHQEALPARVGIDWSFGDWREYTQRIRRQHVDWQGGDVLVELVRLLDTFASYDRISVDALRICPVNAPFSPPENWPALNETDFADAHAVNADLDGRSWIGYPRR